MQHTHRTSLTLAAILGSGFVLAPAAGQTASSTQPALKPIEAGHADINPEALSFRRIDRDFRRPLDFDQIFQFGSGKFVRSSGAINAVFPKSNYIHSEDGKNTAVVPADTRFVIGALPAQPVTSPPAQRGLTVASQGVASAAANQVDRRADHRVSHLANQTPEVRAAVQDDRASQPCGGILGSESDRVKRISELLAQAASDQR